MHVWKTEVHMWKTEVQLVKACSISFSICWPRFMAEVGCVQAPRCILVQATYNACDCHAQVMLRERESGCLILVASTHLKAKEGAANEDARKLQAHTRLTLP